MACFDSDGVQIAYLDEGTGAPVILVHGFASTAQVNWVDTGWVATLTGAGHRVVALDNRGHGASAKLYDSAAYRPQTMAADVLRLMDHLGLSSAALVGYSMGARICAFAALAAPERVAALVLGGMASALVEGVGGEEAIAAALEAPSARAVADPSARGFRVFAEQTKSDLKALAACIRSSRATLTEAEVSAISAPTLVVAGAADTIAGSAEALAAMIPGARALTLPRRDHMSAVGDRLHKSEVVAFLAGHAH